MGPTWPFLLMYRSQDMRHKGFPRVDSGQRDAWDLRRHSYIGFMLGRAPRTKETLPEFCENMDPDK